MIGSETVARTIQGVFPKAQVTDPLAAIIAAGHRLGIKKIGFISPYVAAVSARMRERLEAAGFEIAGLDRSKKPMIALWHGSPKPHRRGRTLHGRARVL